MARPYSMRARRAAIPHDGVHLLRLPARVEGRTEKGGLKVTLPAPVVRGLYHCQWSGSWLRVRLNGGEPFFAVARGEAQKTLALPRRARGAVAAGEVVELEICDAVGYRALTGAIIDDGVLDWAATVPDDAFPVAEPGGVLAVHTRLGPFRLLRRARVDDVAWLLKTYRELGGGSSWATDWWITTKAPAVLARAAADLEACGIALERMALELVRGRDQDEDVVRALYAPVGVTVAVVYRRKAGGRELGTLRVRSSNVFMRMTMAAITALAAPGASGTAGTGIGTP